MDIKTMAGLIKKYPSPISELTRLAQAVHESGNFTSHIFKNTNNAFGVKASAPWKGPTFNAESGEHREEGYQIEASDWRLYDSVEDSVADQALFFVSTDYRKNVAYKQAIEADNYEGELRALTGTYANDPRYADKILNTIKNRNLKSYGMKESASLADIENTSTEKETGQTMSFPKPTIIDRRTQALGYPGRGVYARRPLTNIQYIVWHYTATTHTGYGANVIAAHERYWRSTHGWDIGGYNYYIDRAGNIFWNYDLAIVTYGAGTVNPRAMHISLEASSVSNYTAAQLKAREELTLWLLTNDLKHLGGNAIKGHKEFMSTSCPGYSIAQLNNFRTEFTRKLADKNWVDNKPEEIEVELSKNGKHTVKHGDTLWAIGQAYDVSLDNLREWNSIKEGQWLKTGQNIYVVKPKVNAYTVKAGDYLWKIATENGITVEDLKEWNELTTNLIYVGQELFVSDPENDVETPVTPEPPVEEEVVEEPEDSPETPALELKENQRLRWDGKIVEEVVVGEFKLD